MLLIALITAAGRLVATTWVDHLTIVQGLTFLGVIAGLALGQSKFSWRWATMFALLYGVFAVPWQLGATLERLPENVLWSDRLITMWARLISALGQLMRREAVQDPLLFLFLMAALFWILSVHAAYTLTRHAHPWRAILPAGLALLFIQASDPYVASRAWFLAFYLFLSLLLLARLTYLHNRVRWREAQAHVSSFIAMDLTRIVLVSAALLVLLAWLMPALTDAMPGIREAYLRATRPLRARIREHWENAFASLRRAIGVVSIIDRHGGSLLLGRGREHTDALIMTVQAPPPPPASVRYYWRARVYDHYADGQWSTVALSITQSVAPTEPGLTFPELESRQMVTLTFVPAVHLVTLYAASQPLWVNCPAQADLAYNSDGTDDLAAFRATPPRYASETYQAQSSLSTVTVAQLRAAGTDYPTWVTDRYLQLPLTITLRTRELAREIATGFDTPYDIAAATTEYLRATILYTETVPSPPADQEPLDWFLFDLRRGFCNYYASAEVILLRSLGIPARLAVGFAMGERQAPTAQTGGTYLVRQRHAHSWPEVYFPGIGWIEFEPTASQSPLNRPPGESDSDDAADFPRGEFGGFPRDRWEDRLEELLALAGGPLSEPPAVPGARVPVAVWILLPGLTLVLVALVWRRYRPRSLPPLPAILEQGLRRLDVKPPPALRRWTIRATLSPLARAYLELNRALVRLGAPPGLADTPAERAAALIRLLPPAAAPAQTLLAEYHAATYGPYSGNPDVAQQASRTIRYLSWQADIKERAGNALRPLRIFSRRPTASSYHSFR